MDFIAIYGYPNLLLAPSKWISLIYRFNGSECFTKKHLEYLCTFVDNFDLQLEDVAMKIFSKPCVEM